MPPEMEDNVVDIDVDALFADDPEETVETEPPAKSPESTPETKAVAKRLSEVKAKAEQDTREAMAKELGYASYADMRKANEAKIIKDAGLDEASMETISQLVEKRIADDPRFKKLAEYEAAERDKFVASQLAEINKATGQNFKSIDQLPPETLSLWEKTGNLKQAYFATQGEALLAGKVARAQNGSTAHLANPGSAGGGSKQRALTDEEKDLWRMVDPNITEEELSKKLIDIN